ncbi:argininosuccinate lyase [Muriicola marianensis]|uniref:Argininosuccinate lyase n=1 Tax=Muriicola marianensis TaxID=1324801 RepID=A0ABQ1R361_9FLAO|nr:argininosuccinate lyase [Muriicola marianensis]GGD53125.1 argininosuccinate lyase [Muriicola marianensis]
MKLWEKGLKTDEKIDRFTVGNDRELDLLLAKYDVMASKAHCSMLASIGLLSEEESKAILAELDAIALSIEEGTFTIEEEFEDMHSKIEYLLIQKLGDTGKKIHTARSRNDQVLVAIQLYIKEELKTVMQQVHDLFNLLLDLADTHKKVLLPGYTHLQVAMPSSFGLWFSAYAESLVDDMILLRAASAIADQNPLGSAAGYGSSFPIDRAMTTKELGFATLKYNVVAAQMGRGKVEVSTARALASVGATLAKLSMDICLYMNQNFNFISFPDDLTTGSSIMPHKKNPDVFELVRAKCNVIQALPNELSMLLTNLPSGYHRDLQLTKNSLVPAMQELKACLDILTFSLRKIEVKKDILEDPKYDLLFTVDALNELVKDGMPFRDAYKEIAFQVEKGAFQSSKDAVHTHIGSIGNLCLEEIRQKMERFSK